MENNRNRCFNILTFIEFVIDLANDDPIFYETAGNGIDAKYYFRNGGCYELYKIVKHYFPECHCMINDTLDHCAISYKDKVYDSHGEITDTTHFFEASDEDIAYMERRFGLHIKTLESEHLLYELSQCNLKGILY